MLVLGRLENERLLLDFRGLTDLDLARLRAGQPIEVMVVRGGENKTRLGVEAPKSVGVYRYEAAETALRKAARPIETLLGEGRKAGAA